MSLNPTVPTVMLRTNRARGLGIHPVLAIALVLAAGCGGGNDGTPDAQTACVPDSTAPTYTELYTKYFAAGTPGHCATPECHADPQHIVWLCGPTKDSCYAGMVAQGLVSPSNPLSSLIADPTRSPLSWINPRGPMPFDDPKAFPAGRAAILAWINACAMNN